MSGLLFDPLASFDLIERDEADHALVAWQHRMGPIKRPMFNKPADYGLRFSGELVAIVTADALIRPTCDFSRSEAFELSHLCARDRALTRAVLRLWREIAMPQIVRTWKTPWAISYQNAIMHRGDLYRFDGWQRVGWSTGGSDPRAAAETVSAKKRVIWGWHADHAVRLARRQTDEAEQEEEPWPAWTERRAA